ncbi:MAG: type II toxin-antitoxin system VapC family toxin [Coriobacteriia bacterium]|nr:type II toxin-antitoxin system VapC family toxin [Coriobacteriia bacterium]
MAASPQLVVWDTNVVISYLKRDDENFLLVHPMIELAKSGRLRIVVPEIVVLEALTLGKSINELPCDRITRQLEIIEDFFERSFIIRRTMDRQVTSEAARLRRNYSSLMTRTYDAIVLATAMRYKVAKVYTFDADMLKLDETIPLSNGEGSLRILRPSGNDITDK